MAGVCGVCGVCGIHRALGVCNRYPLMVLFKDLGTVISCIGLLQLSHVHKVVSLLSSGTPWKVDFVVTLFFHLSNNAVNHDLLREHMKNLFCQTPLIQELQKAEIDSREKQALEDWFNKGMP